jgi:hypothetical protein
MLIDHEHFKHDADKETRAFGWLQKLENRADGYYGRIRWTNTGKPAVDGGDYRFFSTEYDRKDLTVLKKEGKLQTVRPLRLDGLTLTNSPNNKGGKPITNRSLAKVPADGCCPACNCALQTTDEPAVQQCPQCQTNYAGANVPAANQTTKNQAKRMKTVANKLGLTAEASEEAILTAVTTLLNRATEAEGKVTTLTNRITPLETENQTLMGEQVDAILADHGIKEPKIANRLKPTLLTLKNRQERLDTLADLGYKPGSTKVTTTTPRVLNRGGAVPSEKADEDAGAQRAKADKITNRANLIMKDNPRISQATAYTMATREAGE